MYKCVCACVRARVQVRMRADVTVCVSAVEAPRTRGVKAPSLPPAPHTHTHGLDSELAHHDAMFAPPPATTRVYDLAPTAAAYNSDDEATHTRAQRLEAHTQSQAETQPLQPTHSLSHARGPGAKAHKRRSPSRSRSRSRSPEWVHEGPAPIYTRVDVGDHVSGVLLL